jgi:hypothetical protein
LIPYLFFFSKSVMDQQRSKGWHLLGFSKINSNRRVGSG